MSDEKKPKRMMARKDFKVLRDRSEELRKAQKQMNQALNDLCDKHADENWWPDKLRVDLGYVLVEGMRDGKITDIRTRIPQEDREPIRKLGEEIERLKLRIADKVFQVAIAAKVPVDQVNGQTGEIMAAKVEECDPAEETQKGE